MLRLVAATTAFLLTTGCAIPTALLLAEGLDNDDDWAVDTGYYFEEASNATGQMRGVMPHNDTFDRELTTGQVWKWEDGLDLNLHATGEAWAMLGGGFMTRSLVEGEVVTLPPDEQWVIGCSGPTEYDAWYDEGAEEVSVQLDHIEIDGEPMMQLTIYATFSSGEITSVVVQPAPDGRND